MKHASILAIALTAAAFSHGQQSETFMGLIVAPENRCSPYDRGDYPYPQSVELDIVEASGVSTAHIRERASPTEGRPT